MILLFRTVAALLAVAALATGCSDSSPDSGTAQPETTTPAATMSPSTTAPAPPGFPVTVIAANGTIEIPEQPSRIVSMSATHTEILFAIGAGDQVVAVDAFSDFPPEAPVTDLTGFAPNVEAIIEYDTDLVVTDGDWDGSSMETLTELGVPVLILPAAETLDEVYGEIETLGAATGHSDRAAALAVAMRSEIDAILRDVPEWSEPPTFYHELDSTYYSVTSDTFIGHLYVLLGLENIADSVGDGSSDYPQLSEEYILQEDPDLIFLADTICCDVSAETLAERPGWDGLTAVENGAVVELDDDVSSRWGPRIVDHLRAVSTAIAALAVE